MSGLICQDCKQKIKQHKKGFFYCKCASSPQIRKKENYTVLGWKKIKWVKK